MNRFKERHKSNILDWLISRYYNFLIIFFYSFNNINYDMNLVIFCDLKCYILVVNYYSDKTIGLLINLCNFLIIGDEMISLILIF